MEAGPPSATYKLRKFARKHRAALATGRVVRRPVAAGDRDQHVPGHPGQPGPTQARREAVAAEQARDQEAKQRQTAEDQRNRAIKAEQTARGEEAKTKQSEAEAKAVLSFFRDKVLAAARPEGQEGGLGKDVKLRAAVDAAEAAIGQAFADQPTVEAAVRETLGEGYHYLGEQGSGHQRV